MDLYVMNLQLFAEEGAAAAPAGGGAEGGTAAVPAAAEPAAYNPGDTLPDGTQVANARVAAALNRQMKRHPEMRGALGQAPNAQQPAAQPLKAPGAEQTPAGEPTIEDRWAELKKGEYKELFGRDVQAAVRDRFKNQADLQGKLDAMQPMLDALMKKTGAQSVDELQKLVLDDDSLYEEEAEAMGMPVEAYKNYKRLQEEHDAAIRREQEQQEQMILRDHFRNLAQQAEEMKKTFPNFDLRAEMENEAFRRLVAPNSGLSLHAAYYAIHHAELEPQAMAYGIQKAQQQMAQTLQANRARPVEGAIKNGQPANVAIDPRSMTREERQKMIERARRGEKIVF